MYRLVTRPPVFRVASKSFKLLSSVIVSNGYEILFLSCRKLPRPENGTRAQSQRRSSKPTRGFNLPYVEGLSEQFRRCLQQQARRTRYFQVGNYANITPSAAKITCAPSRLNKRAMFAEFAMNYLWMDRGDWKTNERHDKGAWPRHPTRPYPDLRRFRVRPKHRTLSDLGWGKVYWSWTTLVHTQGLMKKCGSNNISP